MSGTKSVTIQNIQQVKQLKNNSKTSTKQTKCKFLPIFRKIFNLLPFGEISVVMGRQGIVGKV